jgi:hypothetical protein
LPTFQHYISKPYLTEASYQGNIGFEELVMFYNKASKQEINQLETFLKSLDDNTLTDKEWEQFKRLIKKVTNITLK